MGVYVKCFLWVMDGYWDVDVKFSMYVNVNLCECYVWFLNVFC